MEKHWYLPGIEPATPFRSGVGLNHRAIMPKETFLLQNDFNVDLISLLSKEKSDITTYNRKLLPHTAKIDFPEEKRVK